MSWKEGDWIIYRSDDHADRNSVKCVAVGSRKADHIEGTVIKGFRGTYPEARRETEKYDGRKGK